MPRRMKTKKTVANKAEKKAVGLKITRRDMRFRLSLVILIGMLAFSSLLLLFSLNKSVAEGGQAQFVQASPLKNRSQIKKASDPLLNDSLLDFRLTVPNRLENWMYKIGEVKGLTDKAPSDQYLQILVEIPGVKSKNFNQRNENILTIRRFSQEEWDDIESSCKKGKEEVCDAAGSLIPIPSASDEDKNDWVYAYQKPVDCPESIKAKCALAQEIVQSFQLK